jgi:hypothetical protein
MLTGIIIGGTFGVILLGQNFVRRHEPEPPNSRWKLPSLIISATACVAFAVAASWPVFWAILAAVLLMEIGFVLAGRNPWWMQSYLDRRRERPTSPR